MWVAFFMWEVILDTILVLSFLLLLLAASHEVFEVEGLGSSLANPLFALLLRLIEVVLGEFALRTIFDHANHPFLSSFLKIAEILTKRVYLVMLLLRLPFFLFLQPFHVNLLRKEVLLIFLPNTMSLLALLPHLIP